LNDIDPPMIVEHRKSNHRRTRKWGGALSQPPHCRAQTLPPIFRWPDALRSSIHRYRSSMPRCSSICDYRFSICD